MFNKNRIRRRVLRFGKPFFGVKSPKKMKKPPYLFFDFLLACLFGFVVFESLEQSFGFLQIHVSANVFAKLLPRPTLSSKAVNKIVFRLSFSKEKKYNFVVNGRKNLESFFASRSFRRNSALKRWRFESQSEKKKTSSALLPSLPRRSHRHADKKMAPICSKKNGSSAAEMPKSLPLPPLRLRHF